MPKINAVEKIIIARYYALRVREIFEVHVTFVFLQQLRACSDYHLIASVFDTKMVGSSDPLPIFGRTCVVHREPCDKEFWFTGEDGKEILYILPN